MYGPATFFLRLDDLVPDELEGKVRPPIVHPGDQWIERLCRTGLNPIYTPEAFARAAVLEKVGGYEPRCPYTSDLNMWLRVAAVSDVGFLPGPSQALFRRHESNEGTAYPHAVSGRAHAAVGGIRGVLRDVGRRFATGDLERLARHRLGSDARYAATRAFIRDGDEAPGGEVDRLLELAHEIEPADPLGDRLGWTIRRKLGPRHSRHFPGFMPRPVRQRIGRVRDEHRRHRSGVS